MHISSIREMKTKTPKDVWAIAWKLQRANKAGSPDFPFMLLKVNNLMEYKGVRNRFFTMMHRAERCQCKIYGQVRKHDLQTRLYLKQIEVANKVDV